MSSNNKDKKKISTRTLIILLIIILLAILIVLGILLFSSKNDSKVPETIGGGDPIVESKPVQKDEANISLPGFETITFIADKKQQDFTIPNPSNNTCLVQMSLILSDGMEIWKSELVEPGFYCKPIELIAPIEKGQYNNVTLKYDCFTNDENKSPLNGAEIALTIIAK